MTTKLEQFREEVYRWFPYRSDALMELLDALSSNTTAQSIVQLALNPLFQRQYCSIYDAIDNLNPPATGEADIDEAHEAFIRLLCPYLPAPQRGFWLIATDVTSNPRPYARTLEDQGFVHQPNPVKGVKPVSIGHQYSVLAVLPEKDGPTDPPWIAPLMVNRVQGKEAKRETGLSQINQLMEDQTLSFKDDLCVSVVDSDYAAINYLGRVADHSNLVTIARLPGNRTVYRSPSTEAKSSGRGHPTWFGKPMPLQKPSEWDQPDEVVETAFTTAKGKHFTAQIEGWHDMLFRGKRDVPMHEHPFTLVRVRVFDEQGHLVFRRPMWLAVVGERRKELSLLDVYQSYLDRYDIEHFFRFGKQRLLMDAIQTPETVREENWWTLVLLAYFQLWLARYEANDVPRPWERYLPRFKKEDRKPSVSSPSSVQRDFGRIIRQIGTPARDPKRRGNSRGRLKGQRIGGRTRHPVLKKGAMAA